LNDGGLLGGEMRELLPGVLWVGNAAEARNVVGVLERGIAAVLDLAAGEMPIQVPRDLVYCRFPMVDRSGNDLAVLKAAIDTTATILSSRMVALVACGVGMSRAIAVAAAAVAKLENVDLDVALKRLALAGPHDVSPGFWADVRQVAIEESEE